MAKIFFKDKEEKEEEKKKKEKKEEVFTKDALKELEAESKLSISEAEALYRISKNILGPVDSDPIDH